LRRATSSPAPSWAELRAPTLRTFFSISITAARIHPLAVSQNLPDLSPLRARPRNAPAPVHPACTLTPGWLHRTRRRTSLPASRRGGNRMCGVHGATRLASNCFSRPVVFALGGGNHARICPGPRSGINVAKPQSGLPYHEPRRTRFAGSHGKLRALSAPAKDSRRARPGIRPCRAQSKCRAFRSTAWRNIHSVVLLIAQSALARRKAAGPTFVPIILKSISVRKALFLSKGRTFNSGSGICSRDVRRHMQVRRSGSDARVRHIRYRN